MLKDILDGLKLVAEGIKNVRAIAEAVKDGEAYVRVHHPDVQATLRALLGELEKSLMLVKQASAVLTNFRFAVSTDRQSAELARFNDYFIKAKADEQYLRKNIEDLRTHCSKVRAQASLIAGGAGVPAFLKLFGYLGLRSADREKELADKLDKLAYEDFAVANSAQKMLDCLTAALKDVQDALGTGGAMYPQNVPSAAALLGQLGPAFSDMEELASDGVRDLRSVIEELV